MSNYGNSQGETQSDLYYGDGVTIVQHGGSLYVVGQSGDGFWTALKPLAKIGKTTLDLARKSIGKNEEVQKLVKQMKDATGVDLSGTVNKLTGGNLTVPAGYKLVPVEHQGIITEYPPNLPLSQIANLTQPIETTKPRRQLTQKQLDGLAKGRATAAANRAAKKAASAGAPMMSLADV